MIEMKKIIIVLALLSVLIVGCGETYHTQVGNPYTDRCRLDCNAKDLVFAYARTTVGHNYCYCLENGREVMVWWE